MYVHVRVCVVMAACMYVLRVCTSVCGYVDVYACVSNSLDNKLFG